jgi:hypothetical protein
MLKARLIAESGLNKAYHEIRQDFSLAQNYQLTEEFGGGTYTVSSTPLEGGGENRAQLVSEGICGGGRCKVSADLENRTRTVADDDPTDNYFELWYNVIVGGILKMNGDCGVGVTTIHANGDIEIGGSAAVDAVRVTSAGTIEVKKKDKAEFEVLDHQSPVEIFTAALRVVIDAFIAFAAENGAVYASGADIPESPPGGVAYCTGDPSGWSRTGTGCFIFAGNASFHGGALDVSSVNGYPALIVLGTGEVKLNSGSEVHGAILIPNGSAWINGGVQIYRPFLVGQSVNGNGTANLYAGDGTGFNLPPDQTKTERVVVTAWH